MQARPEAWDELRALGADSVPVVTRGERFVYGQTMADVAELLGLDYDDTPELTPDELVARLDLVLETAQRLVKQLPEEHLDDDVLDRARSYRQLSYHIFRISEVFLDNTIDAGVAFARDDWNSAIPDGMTTMDGIVAYGGGVRNRLGRWWAAEQDKDCARTVPTYWGDHKLHHVLERVTWHPAQHVRQIAMLLERFGIEPDRPLSPADLDGLPLPEKVWDD